jgi:hypothetical protein
MFRVRARIAVLSLFFLNRARARILRKKSETDPRLPLPNITIGSQNSTNVLQRVQKACRSKSYAIQNRKGVFIRARYAKFSFFSFKCASRVHALPSIRRRVCANDARESRATRINANIYRRRFLIFVYSYSARRS